MDMQKLETLVGTMVNELGAADRAHKRAAVHFARAGALYIPS
jgi:hypothetical protein